MVFSDDFFEPYAVILGRIIFFWKYMLDFYFRSKNGYLGNWSYFGICGWSYFGIFGCKIFGNWGKVLVK